MKVHNTDSPRSDGLGQSPYALDGPRHLILQHFQPFMLPLAGAIQLIQFVLPQRAAACMQQRHPTVTPLSCPFRTHPPDV